MGKIVKIILNKNWGRYDFFLQANNFFRKVDYKSKRHKKSTKKKKSQIFQPNFLILYKHIESADTSKPNFFCFKVDFCRHKSEKRKFLPPCNIDHSRGYGSCAVVHARNFTKFKT